MRSDREKGKFYTKKDLCNKLFSLIQNKVHPDIVIDGFSGNGNLIEPFLRNNITCVANDIEQEPIIELQSHFKSALTFNQDFITFPLSKIFNLCQKSRTPIFYSNPPFRNTANKSIARSTKDKEKEFESVEERLTQYGKGDLVIQCIGKMIECVKYLKKGYIALLCPMGIMTGRKKYHNVLRSLLQHFDFLYGEIFDGDNFHSISKKTVISFTIWKYDRFKRTPHEKLNFVYDKRIYHCKKLPLLKEYWRFFSPINVPNTSRINGGASFVNLTPKIITDTTSPKCSACISSINVKKRVNIHIISDELAITLWILAVGRKAIVEPPMHILTAYIHVPDFSLPEVHEILLYSALYTTIFESEHRYTNHKIFFENGTIRFLNDSFTDQLYALSKHLKKTDFVNNIARLNNREPMKLELRNLMSNLVKKIGYWEYIPIHHQNWFPNETLNEWL